MGLSVAEPVFASELTHFLARYAPNAPASIARDSPTAIYTSLPADLVPGVVRAYIESLRIVFLLGAPVGECIVQNDLTDTEGGGNSGVVVCGGFIREQYQDHQGAGSRARRTYGEGRLGRGGFGERAGMSLLRVVTLTRACHWQKKVFKY
jgi:hypothetical protein